LIFRIEDPHLLIRAIKTYCLVDINVNVEGALNFLPGRNNMALLLLIIFWIAHGFSSLSNGSLKYRIVRIRETYWGVLMGLMISMIFILRPSETTQFIYFRF
jgi:hypothetical protein